MHILKQVQHSKKIAMNKLFIITPLAALLFSLLIIPLLRYMAFKIRLIDKPNGRKVHEACVPLVGGIGVFISATTALLFALFANQPLFAFKNMLLGSAVLLVMGAIDDKIDLKASLKLAIQLLLAHYIYIEGIKIESLYGLFGIYEISALAQYILTIIIITGVVNAFNLMDGIDGLAAGIAIVSFIVLSYFAYITHKHSLMVVFLSFIGGLLGFLYFNFSQKRKVFMGDAGSLVLGFVLVVSALIIIQSTNGKTTNSTVINGILGVLLLPVFDSLRVYRKRIKAGKSPFTADKTHLHHLVLELGLKHKWATLFILLLMVSIICVGCWSNLAVGLTFTLFSMLVLFFITTSLLQLNSNVSTWKSRIQGMEIKK